MRHLAKIWRRGSDSRMGTKNSLPEPLRSFVDEQVDTGADGTRSEYVPELIRHDWDRLMLRERLLAGASSAPAGQANDTYFEMLRQRVRERPAS